MADHSMWMHACSQWIESETDSGSEAYYINVMFSRLNGNKKAIMLQMQSAIIKFYGRFCTRFCRHPTAASEQKRLPGMWLIPDRPVFKYDNQPRKLTINAEGLHFNGPLIIPPNTRFKGDVPDHLMKGQPYARGGIQRIHAVPVTGTVGHLSDYI